MLKRRGRPPLSAEEKVKRQEQKIEQIGYNLLLPIQLHEKFNARIFESGISKKEAIERLIQVYLHGIYGTVSKELRDKFQQRLHTNGLTMSQGLEKALVLFLEKNERGR